MIKIIIKSSEFKALLLTILVLVVISTAEGMTLGMVSALSFVGGLGVSTLLFGETTEKEDGR